MKFPDLIPCATPGCRSVLDGSRGPTCVVCQKEARSREEGATSTAAARTAVDTRPALQKRAAGLNCSESVATGGLRVAVASREDRARLRVVFDRLPSASISELGEDPNYFPSLVFIASSCLPVLDEPPVGYSHEDSVGTDARTFTGLVTQVTRSGPRRMRPLSTVRVGRGNFLCGLCGSPKHIALRKSGHRSKRFSGGVSGA